MYSGNATLSTLDLITLNSASIETAANTTVITAQAGLTWGLKLRANSTDRIGFILKDDLTGVDVMTIKAYGIRL